MITRLLPTIKFFKPHHFSSTKKYIPLRPLTEERNLLYVEEGYRKYGLVKKRSFLYQFIPAALVSINNYFMGWNFLTTSGFFFALFGGLLMYRAYVIHLSRIVLCVETSSDLKNLLITVPNRGRNIGFNKTLDSLEKIGKESE